MDFGQNKSTQDFLTKWKNFRISYVDSSLTDDSSESDRDTASRHYYVSALHSGNKLSRQTDHQFNLSPPAGSSNLRTHSSHQALQASRRKKGAAIKKYRHKPQEGDVLTVEDDDTLIFKLYPKPFRLLSRISNAVDKSLNSRKKATQLLIEDSKQNSHTDTTGSLPSQPLSDECSISTQTYMHTNTKAAPKTSSSEWEKAVKSCFQKQEMTCSFEGSPDSSEELDELGEESMPEQCSDPEDELSATGEKAASNTIQVSSLEKPPILASLFNGIPPFLRFVKENETVGQFPPFLSDKLIWRNSTLTPNVVKRALWRSNFTILNNTRDTWIGYFGRHFTAKSFRFVREYQKINHFPGSFNIGRKDRLTVNLQRMKTRFGATEYNFYPPTFILPREYSRLKEFWEEYSVEDQNSNGNRISAPRWILKPPACARGIGVYVVSKLSDVPSRKRLIAQLYLADPFLINGNKFDLRVYVYVSCVDPLQLYIHKTGLVRFASQKYSKSPQNVSNRFIHLTNYSVNRKSGCYRPSGDAHTENAHKWELRELWKYLREHGHNSETIWENIKMLVFKTIASVISPLASNVLQFVACRECVHELFGFDILLDAALKPWLLEVNVSPSLHTSSALDNKIKTEVVVDMLNIAGYRFPPMPRYFKSDGTLRQCRTLDFLFEEARNASSPAPVQPISQTLDACKASPRTEGEEHILQNQTGGDARLFPIHDTYLLRMMPSHEERVKHRAFTAKNQSVRFQKTILEKLTPGDTLVLANVINEWYRVALGNYERVFPRGDEKGVKMMPYVDSSGGDGLSVPSGHVGTPRYYDLLVHQFLRKYEDSKDNSDANPLDIEQVATTDILEDQELLTRISERLNLKPEGITVVATAVRKFLKTRVTTNDIAAEWMSEIYNRNNARSECNSRCDSTQPSISRSSVGHRSRPTTRKHRIRNSSHTGLRSSTLSEHSTATPSKRGPTPIPKASSHNPVLELGVSRRTSSMQKRRNKTTKVVPELTPRYAKRKQTENPRIDKVPIPSYNLALPASRANQMTSTPSSAPGFTRIKRKGQIAKSNLEQVDENPQRPRVGSNLCVGDSARAKLVPPLLKVDKTRNTKKSTR
uniref:Tubulin polyglutamylase TTLL4 n=1 Tax=Schistocephalus solidus TaxID=70667 RepID=A0A0V0JB61_SCHSO